MNMYAVVTNEGVMYVRSATPAVAFRIIANKIGYENVNMARLATTTETAMASPTNITECA